MSGVWSSAVSLSPSVFSIWSGRLFFIFTRRIEKLWSLHLTRLVLLDLKKHVEKNIGKQLVYRFVAILKWILSHVHVSFFQQTWKSPFKTVLLCGFCGGSQGTYVPVFSAVFGYLLSAFITVKEAFTLTLCYSCDMLICSGPPHLEACSLCSSGWRIYKFGAFDVLCSG